MNKEFPETLYNEFIIIQKLDSFFKNKEIILDNEFYTEDYKSFLEEEQREIGIISEEEIPEEEIDFIRFTEEEVMIRIVDYLNVYAAIYDMPPVRISNKKWEDFFDQTFAYYDTNQLSYFYDEDMIMLNRLAIARAILYEKEYLEIEDYIKSIKYIDSRVLSNNNKEELTELTKDKEEKCKIISFQKYLERKQQY